MPGVLLCFIQSTSVQQGPGHPPITVTGKPGTRGKGAAPGLQVRVCVRESGSTTRKVGRNIDEVVMVHLVRALYPGP
jgi:hypothetical protein